MSFAAKFGEDFALEHTGLIVGTVVLIAVYFYLKSKGTDVAESVSQAWKNATTATPAQTQSAEDFMINGAGNPLVTGGWGLTTPDGTPVA